MKREDKIIISLLRENSRMSLTEMSKITKIPISTLYDKMKQYNVSLILKHTSIIDFSQFGYNTRAKVLMKAKKTNLQQLREQLMACPYINELHRVNNGFDYIAEFIFKTAKDMEEYLEDIGQKYELEKEEIFYIVDDIKREDFMSKHKWLVGEN